MDGYMPHMYGYGYPYYIGGMFFSMAVIWIIQLVVGYFVYQDAKKRGMAPILWFILVILPMVGWLFLVIYVIIRETSQPAPADEHTSARAILDERFAKGEITSEEYQKMKEELNR